MPASPATRPLPPASRPEPSATESTEAVERFLLEAREPPAAELLREVCLAAYAYSVLPADHPLRNSLRPDFLASLTRHQLLKQELLPLVAAWRAAGVEVLLFKGFQLAEFVYPVPGARFHGDVDLLIHPEDEPTALRVARELGWRVEGSSVEIGMPYTSGICILFSPAGQAAIDLHRWMLHSPLPWNRVQRRITRAVWERSALRTWHGIPVREPAAVDALLVGLVLQRCWSGDHWHLKPQDAVDFTLLSTRGGVTREELLARARELKCARTLEIFLSRCDPEEGRLRLAPPSRATLRRWDAAVFRERRPLGGLQFGLARLTRLRATLADVSRAVPAVVRVQRRLRRQPDLRRLLVELTPPPGSSHPASRRQRYRSARGVRWAVRLLRVRPGGPAGPCLVRSLALYVLLRQEGWPVAFVSGIRRGHAGIEGHAWVELDGRVLPELGEPGNQRTYRENFRFPADSGPAAVATAGRSAGPESGREVPV